MRHLTLLAAILSGATASAQDYQDPWAGFAKGSTVEIRGKFGPTSTMTFTYTIAKVEKDDIDIETVVRAGDGKPSTSKGKMTRRLTGLPGTSKDESKKLGEEELEVDGKKFTCEVREMRMATRSNSGFHGATSNEYLTIKAWVCPSAGVPGGALKVETVSGSGRDAKKSTLRVVKLRETLKVAGQDLACFVAEEETNHKAESTRSRIWLNAEVPGFRVKCDVKISIKQAVGAPMEVEENYEVMAFQRSKPAVK